MSPGSAAATSGPLPHVCVRCGFASARLGRFLCDDCLGDPSSAFEQRIVEEGSTDYRRQRRVLVDVFGWHGGWWQLDGGDW